MSKEEIEKLIEIEMLYYEKEKEIYINYLCEKIKFYENEIKQLKSNKTLWFQNKKIKAYEDKIQKIYIKLEKELE